MKLQEGSKKDKGTHKIEDQQRDKEGMHINWYEECKIYVNYSQ